MPEPVTPPAPVSLCATCEHGHTVVTYEAVATMRSAGVATVEQIRVHRWRCAAGMLEGIDTAVVVECTRYVRTPDA